MKNELGMIIQSIKLQNNHNLNNKKKVLRQKEIRRCDVFVRRDGHLIRFSTSEPTKIFVESYIEDIRKQESFDIADGSFWLLKIIKGNLYGVRVRGWVPRSFKTVNEKFISKLQEQSYKVFAAEEDNELLNKFNIKNVDLLHLKNNQFPQTYDYKKTQHFIIFSSVVLVVGLIAGYVGYASNSSNEHITISLPEKTITTKIDDYEQYRAFQSNQTTVGRALMALDVAYIIVRNGHLPSNWENKEIEFVDGVLKGKITQTSKGIAKISDIKTRYKDHPSKKFISIDGQNVSMSVPITADGAAFANTVSSMTLEELRDNVIDSMAELKVNEVLTDQYKLVDGYKTQMMKIVFDDVSPLMIGRLSRAFANKPIYLDSLTLKQNQRNINLELTLMFIELNNEKTTEAQ